MAITSMNTTLNIAKFIVQSKFESIPSVVRHEAARALLNWSACAVGGSTHETVDNAIAAVLPFTGQKQAGVFGRKERMDIQNAALINGISSHVLDFDDTHVKAIHPSAPVWPALLALAEWKSISGADLVHAYILGVEAECRIGLSVVPEHYDIGWHITGTVGVFGAAAAAGKILSLNEQQMAWALGIAATQSAGLREMFGSMCKCLHPGSAAQNGLRAAFLALNNFTSSEQAIEAKRGWGHVLSTKFDASAITTNLGATYELSKNMYKPFACGLVVHGTIDGCIQLRNEFNLTAEMIERIDLKVGAIVMELTGKTEPTTGLEGKFSVFHVAAVSIIQGAAGEAQFSDECVRDPEIVKLRRKVHAVIDPQLEWAQARITITLKDGRILDRLILHPLGSLERPMSDQDLETKFVDLTAGILSPEKCKEAIQLCWSIESLSDAGAIPRALTIS